MSTELSALPPAPPAASPTRLPGDDLRRQLRQEQDKLRRLSKSHARLKETAREATARAQAAEALVHPTPHIADCDSSARPSPAVWGAAQPIASRGGPRQATPTLPSPTRGRNEL